MVFPLPFVSTEVITNGNMVGDLISAAITLSPDRNMGFEFIWTGTPTGTLGLEITMAGSDGPYVPLDLSGAVPPLTQPAGSSGVSTVDLVDQDVTFVKVTYAHVSGAGTLSVFAVANK
jgi:hypothetical protein